MYTLRFYVKNTNICGTRQFKTLCEARRNYVLFVKNGFTCQLSDPNEKII